MKKIKIYLLRLPNHNIVNIVKRNLNQNQPLINIFNLKSIYKKSRKEKLKQNKKKLNYKIQLYLILIYVYFVIKNLIHLQKICYINK